MRQDDYFLNQIDLLGRVLGKIIADLLNLKNQGQIIEGIDTVSQILKNELDFDLNGIILIPTEDLVEFIDQKNKLSIDNLEKLAEILFIIGVELKQKNQEKMNHLLVRSLVIFEHINAKSSTFSIERMSKIEKIKNFLSSQKTI